jgi:acetyl-CoA carboxylase biotin carboxyl carrier protein
MKIEEIRTIVRLMSENDLSEFKIEAEEMRLCIKRGTNNTPVITTAAHLAPMAAAPAPAAAAPAAAAEEKSAPAADDNRETIDSPIVGTFYRAPSPDADPFIKVGARVEADTVVCIVEAMKVMNEIKAEKSGVIKEILVDNANPVEYGQPLFVLE